MKRYILLQISVLLLTALNAQSYFDINFTGANVVLPQTIQVTNLTKRVNVTLQGTDILRLKLIPSGMQDIQLNQNQFVVFPNPMVDYCYLKFSNLQQGSVIIQLHSIDGKLLLDYNSNIPDSEYTYKISGVPNGLHILTIKSSAGTISKQITSTGKSNTNVLISPVGYNVIKDQKEVKSGVNLIKTQIRDSVEMSYSIGDNLYFLGSADGHVSQAIYASPTENKTISFFLTQVVDVLNPITGKVWMDRNLGASRVATSSTDSEAYGDLYQWGRCTDGHEKRTSTTTSILSTNDLPSHGYFIIVNDINNDWRNQQNNNLWQGVNGINNPCPTGYRLPTITEWETERASWSSNNSTGAFASQLKLSLAGNRYNNDGLFETNGFSGHYWSSTFDWMGATHLYFYYDNASIGSYLRACGYSVRCVKD